jgi:hypothetical protein
MHHMSRVLVLACVAGLWGVLAAHTRADDPAPDTRQLIDGLLARSDAVFSGRMTYRFAYFASGKAEKPVHEFQVRLTFSGSSWIKRSTVTGQPDATVISHNGTTLEYVPTNQKDERVTKLARLRPARPVNTSGPEVKTPIFVGSFWRSATKKYVEENRRSVVNKGYQEVNGERTVVLEWEIPRNDVDAAFGGSNPGVEDGGLLRLYVAPQLGHVMPRIDFLSPQGEVMVRCDSIDFIKTPSGVYFPTTSSERLFAYNRDNPSRQEYTIWDIENINEPIPDSEFSFPVPVGTEVIDTRDEKRTTRFILSDKEPLPVSGLETILGRDQPSFWARNRTTAIILGVAAGVLLVLATLVVRHVRRRRTAPA